MRMTKKVIPSLLLSSFASLAWSTMQQEMNLGITLDIPKTYGITSVRESTQKTIDKLFGSEMFYPETSSLSTLIFLPGVNFIKIPVIEKAIAQAITTFKKANPAGIGILRLKPGAHLASKNRTIAVLLYEKNYALHELIHHIVFCLTEAQIIKAEQGLMIIKNFVPYLNLGCVNKTAVELLKALGQEEALKKNLMLNPTSKRHNNRKK